MTRAHLFVLDGTRLIVPLYSDGFSFSLMAITDDWGATWKTSTPLVGLGISNRHSPAETTARWSRSCATTGRRRNASRSASRRIAARPGARWWTPDRPNPGSGAEVLRLKNGNWVLVYNDLERGRYSLAVSLSDDEGRTWRWTRHLERDAETADQQNRGEHYYPSIIQAADGACPRRTASYAAPPASVTADAQQRLPRKSIKHAHFNEARIRQLIRGASPLGLPLHAPRAPSPARSARVALPRGARSRRGAAGF